MKNIRYISMITFIAIVIYSLAGCGSSGGSTTGTDASNPGGSTSPAAISAYSGVPKDIAIDTGGKTMTVVQGGMLGVAVAVDATTIQYIADPGKTGDDTFAYSLNGGPAITVNMKVTAPAVAPVVVITSRYNPNANSAKFDSLGRTYNPATDVIQITQQPTYGTATLKTSGPDAGLIVYEPYMLQWQSLRPAQPDTFAVIVNGVTKTVNLTILPPSDSVARPATWPPTPVYSI